MHSLRGAGFMSASTARIYVNVDEKLKQNTQRVFNEMGMDMTTAITLFLKTVEREECIPFNIRTRRAFHGGIDHEYIKTELEKSMQEANDPNTPRFTHEEVMASLRQQREARNHAI
jgi:DNA-damage-inducible protein J